MTTNPLVPVPAATPIAEAPPRARPSYAEIVSWVMIGGLILYVLMMRVTAAVIGGLALYLVLDRLAQSLEKRIPGMAARTTSVILVTLIGGGVLIGALGLSISFLQHHVDALPAMMRQMADILRSTRLWLGDYGRQLIPDVLTDAENIKGAIVVWLKAHAETLRVAGSTFSVGLLHVFMGMLLAIVVFFRHVVHHDETARGPLAFYLTEKVDRFAHIFSRIAVAQIKVSAINTLIVAFYLAIFMVIGKAIPFTTTLILITFVCGLVPIFGNIVSNAVLVILSLGVSEGTAIASLIFVVALSKLQYVLTSRMVGGTTNSQAWEILFAIIIGEAAFGVAGVVMAPIVYAFVKRELRDRGLV